MNPSGVGRGKPSTQREPKCVRCPSTPSQGHQSCPRKDMRAAPPPPYSGGAKHIGKETERLREGGTPNEPSRNGLSRRDSSTSAAIHGPACSTGASHAVCVLDAVRPRVNPPCLPTKAKRSSLRSCLLQVCAWTDREAFSCVGLQDESKRRRERKTFDSTRTEMRAVP